MVSRCMRVAVLGFVAVGMAVTTEKQKKTTIGPTHVKPCQHLCSQAECPSLMLRTSDLSCPVANNSAVQQLGGKGIYLLNAIKHKEEVTILLDMVCGWHTNVTDGISKQSQQEREENMTRILMLPHSIEEGSLQGRQLFLHSNLILPYPYIRTQGVKAIAYIASSKKLIIAFNKPPQLSFTRVDDMHLDIIRENESFTSISVDETKNLIFLTALLPRPRVFVMTTEGKDLRPIITFKKNKQSGAMVADVKRSVIYVTILYSKLIKYSYKGVKIDTPFKRFPAQALQIDPEADILYFNAGMNPTVHRMYLNNNTVENMKQFGRKVLTLYVFKDLIYIGRFPFAGDIDVGSSDGKMIKLITGYNTDQAGGVWLVAVP